MGPNLAPRWGSQLLHRLIGKFLDLIVPSHKAKAYQILHVAVSSGLLLNLAPPWESEGLLGLLKGKL